MPECKITVLKTTLNKELAEEYRSSDLGIEPCPLFVVGQEFLVDDIGEKPENFACGWAWNDINKVVVALMSGGDFSQWMKEGNTYIACCTDGIKPVVFKLEGID
jgi:uncharacterized repeat protein (TIGR04076 family)